MVVLIVRSFLETQSLSNYVSFARAKLLGKCTPCDRPCTLCLVCLHGSMIHNVPPQNNVWAASKGKFLDQWVAKIKKNSNSMTMFQETAIIESKLPRQPNLMTLVSFFSWDVSWDEKKTQCNTFLLYSTENPQFHFFWTPVTYTSCQSSIRDHPDRSILKILVCVTNNFFLSVYIVSQ